MDELEKALTEYLAKNFGQGDVVQVKQLRDDVASQFITKELPVSEALSTVRLFVGARVRERVLLRIGSGRYTYWPERNADALEGALSNVRPALRASDYPLGYPFESNDAFASFETVEALARSSQFLVQSGLSRVDLGELQGLSF